MKIALITGSVPPQPCGVGDFSYCLAVALQKQGVRVELVTHRDWRAQAVIGLKREILHWEPDVVHIQYPTLGFGSLLGPQALSMIVPSVVTLHETSRVHILRRLSMYAFTLRRQEVIFTTEFERQYAIRCAPWIRTRSTVIPLGTSITPSIACGKREKHEIVHFGLIRNDKGLEEVLRLAKLIRDRRLAFRIRIVGHVYAGCQEYFEKLRSDSCYLPVTWETTLADEQVGEVLANATFAYLPFPDGASERRSSMIAALASKLVVISTRGAQTPSSLNGVVEFCQGAEDALNAIQFLSDNRESQKFFLDGAERYCQLRSWESIASQHIRLYATCGGLSENRRLEPPVTDSGQSCLR